MPAPKDLIQAHKAAMEEMEWLFPLGRWGNRGSDTPKVTRLLMEKEGTSASLAVPTAEQTKCRRTVTQRALDKDPHRNLVRLRRRCC